MAEGMTFRFVGGSLQPMVRKFEDLQALAGVDAARWAMTSVPVSALRVEDPRFLSFLDRDGDKMIRIDEVLTAIRFLLDTLSDGSGVTAGASELKLAAVRQTEETAALRLAAGQILSDLGKSDASTVSLADFQAAAELKSGRTLDASGIGTDLGPLVTMISEFASVSPEALTSEHVRAFQEEVKSYFAWLASEENDPELAPFGTQTAGIYADYHALRPALDDFFFSCAALQFLDQDPVRTAKKNVDADVMAPDEVHAALAKLSLAAPVAEGVLDLSGALNPRWREVLLRLAAQPACRSFFEGGKLSASAWEDFKKRFVAYEKHLAGEPGKGRYSAMGAETLRTIFSGPMPEMLLEFCEGREAAHAALSGRSELLKLLLFQKDLLRFLNNFANLSDLFDTSTISMLQTGTLVMDGRHFTFVTPVANLAEHKRIAATSNICTIYLELFCGASGARANLPVAAAVTSGSMRDLFIGKQGVFFRPDGSTCGARIIDFIEQPVSVPEALKSPFLRFGRFISQFVEKFFSSQTDEMQKNIGRELNSGLTGSANAASGKPWNGSMLLMGGGIGIAAIGSSVALIAQALKSVSLLRFLCVLLGIFLIFGGPLVIISLVKLYCRNLGRFLEASGCALNRSIRLSVGMGSFFTRKPAVCGKIRIAPGAIGEFSRFSRRGFRLLWILVSCLLAAMIGAGVGIGVARWTSRPGTKAVPEKGACAEKTILPQAPADGSGMPKGK